MAYAWRIRSNKKKQNNSIYRSMMQKGNYAFQGQNTGRRTHFKKNMHQTHCKVRGRCCIENSYHPPSDRLSKNPPRSPLQIWQPDQVKGFDFQKKTLETSPHAKKTRRFKKTLTFHFRERCPSKMQKFDHLFPKQATFEEFLFKSSLNAIVWHYLSQASHI